MNYKKNILNKIAQRPRDWEDEPEEEPVNKEDDDFEEPDDDFDPTDDRVLFPEHYSSLNYKNKIMKKIAQTGKVYIVPNDRQQDVWTAREEGSSESSGYEYPFSVYKLEGVDKIVIDKKIINNTDLIKQNITAMFEDCGIKIVSKLDNSYVENFRDLNEKETYLVKTALSYCGLDLLNIQKNGKNGEYILTVKYL